jgi:hypothetical protein
MYSIPYSFNPNDVMWVLDGNTVKKGSCMQVEIKVNPAGSNSFVVVISYIVLLDCNGGTITISDSNAFQSLEDAILALQNYITAVVC